MQIVTKKDAKLIGLKHFFTGKPCKRGHIDRRFVSTGVCVSCNRDNVSSGRVENRHDVVFTYRIHREDFPAAQAFCEALRLQRGWMPRTPQYVDPTAQQAATAALCSANSAIAPESNDNLPRPWIGTTK